MLAVFGIITAVAIAVVAMVCLLEGLSETPHRHHGSPQKKV